MIDLHAHILPGVDDGATSEAQSCAMLDAAASIGITTIVATPHVNGQKARPTRDAYFALYPRASERGITLLLGCELNIDIAQRTTNWLPYCFTVHEGGQRYLLLELNRDTSLNAASFMVSDMVQRGITPILAHPERYLFVEKNPAALRDLRVFGSLLQVDAGAYLLPFWHKMRRTALALQRLGAMDFIASDAHKPEHYADLAKVLKTAHVSMPGEEDF